MKKITLPVMLLALLVPPLNERHRPFPDWLLRDTMVGDWLESCEGRWIVARNGNTKLWTLKSCELEIGR